MTALFVAVLALHVAVLVLARNVYTLHVEVERIKMQRRVEARIEGAALSLNRMISRDDLALQRRRAARRGRS